MQDILLSDSSERLKSSRDVCHVYAKSLCSIWISHVEKKWITELL